MDDNHGAHGLFGLIIVGIVAAGAAIFIVTGGELGGKQKVESDADLPPVVTSPK